MTIIRCICIIFFLAGACPAARYALLVGNSSAGRAYTDLKYVKNDLDGMRRVLSELCGFDRDHITTLCDQTPQQLEQSLDRCRSAVDSAAGKDLFFFYYSGHSDAGNLLMGTIPYPLSSLNQRLTQFPSAIRIAVFDACQSGSFTRLKGGSLDEPFLFKEPANVAGQVVLYSSSANENSQESDEYKNSIFTFHFINALKGCGDASGDRQVTLTEAYQYSYNQTVTSTLNSAGGVQHPGYLFRIMGEGNIVLADINARSCGIALADGIGGAIAVLNADQALVAEMRKEAGARVLIALDPGRYDVVLSRDGTALVASVKVSADSVSTIGAGDFRKRGSYTINAKGRVINRWQLGFKAACGGMSADLDGLGGNLNAAFHDFGAFGMAPAFTFPRTRVIPGFEVEMILRNGVTIFGGGEYFRMTGQQSYTTDVINPFDGKAYPYSLDIEDTLRIGTYHTGVGYCFRGGALRNLSVGAGVDFAFIDFKLDSRLSDGLFNVERNTGYGENGQIALPFVQVGYRYSIVDKLTIGAEVRGRYWKTAQTISVGENPLAYNLSGVVGRLFIMLAIGR
jgi:hypothetical protein